MADNLNPGNRRYDDLYNNTGYDFDDTPDYSAATDYSTLGDASSGSSLRSLEAKAANRTIGQQIAKRDIAAQERSSQFNTEAIDNHLSDNSPAKKRMSGVKKSLVGGGLGLLTTGGLTLGLFTIVSGPMQLIQGAKLIEDFHLGVVSAQQTARSLGSITDISKNFLKADSMSDRIKNSRLSLFGQVQANAMEKRLAKNGVTIDSTAFGAKNGISIDLSDKTDDQIKSMVNALGIGGNKISIDGKKVKISSDIGYTEARKVISSFDDPGKNKLVSWLQGRATLKKNGYVSWLHPFEKAKAKAYKKVTDFITDQIGPIMGNKTDLKKHVNSDQDKHADQAVDGDGNSTLDQTKSRSGELIDEATSDVSKSFNKDGKGVRGALGKAKGTINSLNDFLNIKAVIGVTMIISVICMIQDLVNNAGPYKQMNIVNIAEKGASQLLGYGSQVQSGEDINLEIAEMAVKTAYGAEVEALDLGGNETGQTVYSSFWDAPAICQTTGTSGCKNDASSVPDSLQTAGTGAKFTSNAAINNTINDVLNNGTITGILSRSVCFINDAVDTIANLGQWILGKLLSPIINATGLPAKFLSLISDYFYGKPLNLLTLIPEQWGSVAMYGGKFMSNDQALTMGGRRLNTQEAIELNLENRRYLAWENNQKPLMARLFSPTDYNSAINQVARSVRINSSSQNLTTQLANVFKTFTSAPTILATAANQLTGGSAYAASAYNYGEGINTWAYSVDELNGILEDDSYDVYSNAEWVMEKWADSSSAERKQMSDYADKCLSVEVDYNDNSGTGDFAVTAKDNQDGTAWNYVDANVTIDKNDSPCKETEATKRFRVYVMDYFNTTSGACYFGDEDDTDSASACNEMQIDAGGSTSSLTSISTAGNKDPEEYQKLFVEESGDGVWRSSWGDTYDTRSNGCTTISAWFIDKHTTLKYGMGDGKDVVKGLISANPGLESTSKPTKAPAVFSASAEPMTSSPHGHVGLVTAIDADGTIHTLESGSGAGGRGNPWSYTKTRTPAEYTAGNTEFVYVGDHLK
ncbi:MAG: hypothetical protein Q4C83_00110 [Candidatus Saccharibacteria bacterium]|nr:hypothetical protein [Candidatus Saccharibacteria bacterium]